VIHTVLMNKNVEKYEDFSDFLRWMNDNLYCNLLLNKRYISRNLVPNLMKSISTFEFIFVIFQQNSTQNFIFMPTKHLLSQGFRNVGQDPKFICYLDKNSRHDSRHHDIYE
jgi:hypothetical protein